MKNIFRKRGTYHKAILLVIIMLLSIYIMIVPVSASGIDDVLPSSMYDVNHAYILYAPDSESMDSTGNNLCLNLLSNGNVSNYMNITKAPYTSNGTQWFRHMYVFVGSSLYIAWATYNDNAYSINCNRSNEIGSYVNIYKIANNPRGDLNIHSPICFNSNNGSHFLSACARYPQQSVMCIEKTGESTGYTNNTYLIWRPIDFNNGDANQHVFFYDITTSQSLYQYYCIHVGTAGVNISGLTSQ